MKETMAKPRIQTAILFAAALCLSLSGVVQSTEPDFYVEGQIYCEVCRSQFINRLSEPMPGAKVKLECRHEENGTVTFTTEGETNERGAYRIPVEGDHADEICEVTMLKSSRPDCEEIPDEGWAGKPTSRVGLTVESGIHDKTRNANPLGFTKKEPDPACYDLYKDLDMLPEGPQE